LSDPQIISCDGITNRGTNKTGDIRVGEGNGREVKWYKSGKMEEYLWLYLLCSQAPQRETGLLKLID